MAETILLVATKKGLFVVRSRDREEWRFEGPYLDNWPSNHAIYDADSGAIYACATNAWYGASVWRSPDLGATWTQSSEGLTYGEGGPEIAATWSLCVNRGTVYAGVEPAGLFRSDDQGATWKHVAALREHPSAPMWQPGGGGLILHTIVGYPDDAEALSVAISTGGMFHTSDGGATWNPRNRGVRADFVPEPEPEVGQCVHHLEVAANGTTLYQQNHCGVYRSDDVGMNWSEITAGLPSQFGFPLACDPKNVARAWTVPLNGDDAGRFMPDAETATWRTDDSGATWTKYTKGLPDNAYLGVFRQALSVDTHPETGVYFGSTTGHLFASIDAGESWNEIASYLPGILSVEAAVVE